MNRKTFMVLAVAGGLGSSAASATTYLCETDRSDSYRICAEVASASSTAMNFGLPESAPVMTYYAIERPVTTYFVESPVATYYSYERAPQPSASALRVVPTRTVTTYEYSGKWPNTEPRVSTYRYYTLDSAR